MTQGLYVVVDNKAGQALGGVHVFRHDAPAVRMFTDIHADEQSVIHKHPSDFALVRVGRFDDELLLIEAHDPVVIVTGEAVAAMQRQGGADA